MKNKIQKKYVIEPSELATLLEDNKNLKLVDASYPPQQAYPLYMAKRIGEAVYFDIDEIADKSAPLLHTIPAPEAFASAVSKLGISNEDTVIIYDQNNIAMAASRVWWMFRLYGHTSVCVLNGGLPYWEAAGNSVNMGQPPSPQPTSFTATFHPELLLTIEQVKELNLNDNSVLLDARSQERFSGSADAGPDMASGHIPNSYNLPFMDLIDQNGCLKPHAELDEKLSPYLDKPIATTCGSGVTACVIALALAELGYENTPVYDGSWTEWGQKNLNMPIATGTAS